MFTINFLGRFKRFAAVGGSDGVLRGFGEWLEEDPIGRFCMLNRRNYTRNGHDWNPMPGMELESLRGVRIFGRGGGVREAVLQLAWFVYHVGPKEFIKHSPLLCNNLSLHFFCIFHNRKLQCRPFQ